MDYKKLLDLIPKEQIEKYLQPEKYTEKEVEELLHSQRGNCYVAALNVTKDRDLAIITPKATEPSGGKWKKSLKLNN